MRVALRSLKLTQAYILEDRVILIPIPTLTTINTMAMITATITQFQDRIHRPQNDHNPMILMEHQAGGTVHHRTRCFLWTKHSS